MGELQQAYRMLFFVKSKKRVDYMHIYLSSSSKLYLDLLTTSIKQKRPQWLTTVDTSLNSICQKERRGIAKEKYDAIVIETSYKRFNHFSHHIEKLRALEVFTIFLVDEEIGEVYMHTNDVPHFQILCKNTTLNQLIEVIEKRKYFNVSTPIMRKLTTFEDKLLLELSKGQSIEYFHKTQNISYRKIEETLENINQYFNTSHYLQAVYKAHEQNYFQTDSFK